MKDNTSLPIVIRNIKWQRDENNQPKSAECEAVSLARMIDLLIHDYPDPATAIARHCALEVGLRRLYALVIVEEHVVTGRSDRSSAWQMCDAILETLPVTRNGVRGLENIMTGAVLRNTRKRKALLELEKTNPGKSSSRKSKKKWYGKGSGNSKTGNEAEYSVRGKPDPKPKKD